MRITFQRLLLKAATPGMTLSLNRLPVPILYTLTVLLVYWPVSTLSYSIIGWDMFDCWLSWYTFMAESIQQGQVPAWNPFQQGGYPVNADLQGGAWSPITYLIVNTIGHSVYSLTLMVFVILVIAATGMYRLCLELNADKRSAFYAGCAFMLSGFFMQHMMHLQTFQSGAWIIWLLFFLIRLVNAPNMRDVLLCSIVAMLQVTGGNHTFSIIFIYLAIILFLTQLIEQPASERLSWTLLRTKHVLGLVGLVTLLCSGFIYSVIEVLPYFHRNEGLSLQQAAYGSATIHSLTSLLVPFTTGVNTAEIGVESSPENFYFGTIALFGFLAMAFRKSSSTEKVFLAAGLFFVIVSFGTSTPVYPFLYNYLPGVDMFRFPGFFLFFAVICFIPLAANSITTIDRIRRARVYYTVFFSALLLYALLRVTNAYSSIPNMWESILFNTDFDIFHRLRWASWTDRILANSSLLLIVAFVGLVLTMMNRMGQRTLIKLGILELLLFSQLNIWNASISNIPPDSVHAVVQANPSVPSLPNAKPLAHLNDSTLENAGLWRNTSNFLKRYSRDAFNSFWLGSFTELETDTLSHDLGRLPLAFTHNGTLESATGSTISWTAVDHHRFALAVENDREAQVCLQQSPYPPWKAKVNGEEVDIEKTFISTLSVAVPKGRSMVEFFYDAPWLNRFFLFSMFVLLFIVLYLAWWFRKDEKPSLRFVFILSALAIFIASSHMIKPTKTEILEASWQELIESTRTKKAQPELFLADIADKHFLPQEGPYSAIRVDELQEVSRTLALLDSLRPEHLWLAWNDRPLMHELRLSIASRFEQTKMRYDDGHSGLIEYLDHKPIRQEWETIEPGQQYSSTYEFDMDSLSRLPEDLLFLRTQVQGENLDEVFLFAQANVQDKPLYFSGTNAHSGMLNQNTSELCMTIPCSVFRNKKGKVKFYLMHKNSRPMRYQPIEVLNVGRSFAH